MNPVLPASRELLDLIMTGVEPPPDPVTVAALHASLQRQVVAVGPSVARAAARRLAAALGPACVTTRRARFGGIAAALAADRGAA